MKSTRRLEYWATALAAAAMVGLPATAANDESGGYVTFDLGASLQDDLEINGTDVSMEVGWRLDVAAGYRVNRYTRVGFATGFLYNEVEDNLNGERLMQVPLLGVVEFAAENKSRFTPYIGGGVGGVATFSGDDYETDSDFVFAWQFEGGLRFRINPEASIGLAYKYLWTDEQAYDFGLGSVEVGSVVSHMIGLRLDWAF